MSFISEEITYLASQPLARLATVTSDGQPDVVPVAFEFDGSAFWVGGGGESVLSTRKIVNVMNGNREVALVVDDMISFNPFVARGIRIYGHASDPMRRTGLVGPGFYLRITPTTSWSWNMNAQPVGDTWYTARRAEHSPPSS